MFIESTQIKIDGIRSPHGPSSSRRLGDINYSKSLSLSYIPEHPPSQNMTYSPFQKNKKVNKKISAIQIKVANEITYLFYKKGIE